MPPTPASVDRHRLVFRADFDHLDARSGLWACGPDPEHEARDARLRETVARVLTARQRSIVEWHFFEGLSQSEIARRLGVSQQVVQRALYGAARGRRCIGGALRRLREALLAQPLGAAEAHGP
ncbi:MAG: hypothetical protein JNK72_13575 [Myxococcales bacterium]|nr:hypothetical protein [Myxococcales bacterium]